MGFEVCLKRMLSGRKNGDQERKGEALRFYLDSGLQQDEISGRAESLRQTGDLLGARQVLLAGVAVLDELANDRLWAERLNQPKKRKSPTIQEGIKAFLADFQKSVRLGKRKASTYGTWIDRLKHAEKNIHGAISSIDETTLRNYHDLLTKSTKMGGQRQSNVFKAFRAFVRWCWQEGLLESMPRNLGRNFEFADDSRPKEMYDPAEIPSMLAKLPARGRAAVWLGLNCGFTVGDIADLKKQDADLAREESCTRESRPASVNQCHWFPTNYGQKRFRLAGGNKVRPP